MAERFTQIVIPITLPVDVGTKEEIYDIIHDLADQGVVLCAFSG